MHWSYLSPCSTCSTGASFSGQQGGLHCVPDRGHRLPHHTLRLLHLPGQELHHDKDCLFSLAMLIAELKHTAIFG